jgi:MFS family permease
MSLPVVGRVFLAKGLRAFGDGFVSLLLPAYLVELGFGPLQVGAIATATLLGSGVAALGVGYVANRYSYRALLLAAAFLMAATGVGFAALTDFWPLMLVAVVGTLNPSSGDVSVFLPLEHALMSHVVADRDRTTTFARYSLAGALMGALGAFAAGVPQLAQSAFGMSSLAAMQAMFVAYSVLGLACALVYRGMKTQAHEGAVKKQAPLGRSRNVVYLLATLFSIDAFGGGLVVQSMVVLWMYGKFAITPGEAGTIFFATGLLSAISFLVAVPVARRFGLVNTMVFTHIPANLCAIAIPFMDDLGIVVALLLLRSALSQMDVPTRSSYVMAIVDPAERPAAASVTSVPRSLASAASPLAAGWLLTVSPFGWPLVAAGCIKIAYDLMLLATFRNVRPPEERAGAATLRNPA